MTNKRVTYIAVVLGCTALAGFFAYRVVHGSGNVVVRVSNQGDATMRNVTIFVTGRSYDIGDIQPGEQRSTRVSPKGKSHVEIAFEDARTGRLRLNGGGYFVGTRDVGVHDVEVRNGEVTSIRSDVKLPEPPWIY
jgi:hypothetical protein